MATIRFSNEFDIPTDEEQFFLNYCREYLDDTYEVYYKYNFNERLTNFILLRRGYGVMIVDFFPGGTIAYEEYKRNKNYFLRNISNEILDEIPEEKKNSYWYNNFVTHLFENLDPFYRLNDMKNMMFNWLVDVVLDVKIHSYTEFDGDTSYSHDPEYKNPRNIDYRHFGTIKKGMVVYGEYDRLTENIYGDYREEVEPINEVGINSVIVSESYIKNILLYEPTPLFTDEMYIAIKMRLEESGLVNNERVQQKLSNMLGIYHNEEDGYDSIDDIASDMGFDIDDDGHWVEKSSSYIYDDYGYKSGEYQVIRNGEMDISQLIDEKIGSFGLDEDMYVWKRWTIEDIKNGTASIREFEDECIEKINKKSELSQQVTEMNNKFPHIERNTIEKFVKCEIELSKVREMGYSPYSSSYRGYQDCFRKELDYIVSYLDIAEYGLRTNNLTYFYEQLVEFNIFDTDEMVMIQKICNKIYSFGFGDPTKNETYELRDFLLNSFFPKMNELKMSVLEKRFNNK